MTTTTRTSKMRLLPMCIWLSCCGSATFAADTLFNIELSGVSNLGNSLTVIGSVRLDPALPINNSNIGPYSLSVQRNAETPTRSLGFIALAIPNDTTGDMQLEWSLVGENLYVSRTSNEDSSVTYVGVNLFAPQTPTASFNLGSGTLAHSITFGDVSGIETAVLKGASEPDGADGFLVGTIAPIPEPSTPVCELELTQSRYTDGEITELGIVRFANFSEADLLSRLIIELKYDAANFSATAFDVGSDSSIVLPPGFDLDFGPQPVLPVSAALPRGTWAYRCAIVDPITGHLYAEDTAEFEVISPD